MKPETRRPKEVRNPKSEKAAAQGCPGAEITTNEHE